MANKIDLRDVPRDESGRLLPSLGEAHGTSHNRIGNVTFHELPSFHRDYEREIYLAIATAGRGMTRAEICKSLNLKKTNWLVSKIERLVDSGFLVRIESRWKNGVVMFFYEVNQ